MPNSIFNGNPMYLPPVQYNLQDYTAPDLGIQASAGQTPYDRWLFAQNSRMGDISLPSFSAPYTAVNPSNPYQAPGITPVGAAPGSGGVYDTNPFQPVTPTPPPTSSTAPTQSSGASGKVVAGPFSDAPVSAEDQAYYDFRKKMQDLVASGDQEAVLRYMVDNGVTREQFNDALTYSSSPINASGQTANNWLIGASQNTGINIPGMEYASPEEVRQFLDWQQSQTNVLTNQNIGDSWLAGGIADPYSNQRLVDNAQDAITREKALAAQRTGYTPAYQTYSTPTSPMTQVQSNPAMVQAPAPAPVPQAPPQPQYQQVAGSFVNQDTGDIVNYDSNGVHTSTGRVDSAWRAAHQPAPQQPTQQQTDRWDLNSDNRDRGGLIKLSQKYASGGGVNALAGKYNLY